jgi:hypothetical protein
MWPRVKHYLKIYLIVEGVKGAAFWLLLRLLTKKVNSLTAEIMLRFFILLKIPAYIKPHVVLHTLYTTSPASLVWHVKPCTIAISDRQPVAVESHEIARHTARSCVCYESFAAGNPLQGNTAARGT